ncbi:MAG: DUF1850 domain-containing protein [Burkholderiaceae bacterium]
MPAALIAAALLCLAAPGYAARLPADRFTLVWQHSIEKIDWEEDYVVAGDWLYLSGARIRGTGAGMEPPDDAQRVGAVYVYRPALRWFRELDLARSDFVQDYRLCVDGRCAPMSDWVPVAAGMTVVKPCATPSPAASSGRAE